jgi:hypothetical protein
MELPVSLSQQASLALLGYVLVAVALFLPVKSAASDEEKQSYKLMDRLGVFAMMLIPMALSIYTINCLVAGQCSLWSWVNSGLVFLWSIVIFGVSLYAAFRVPAIDAPPTEPFQQLPSMVGAGPQLMVAQQVPVTTTQQMPATASQEMPNAGVMAPQIAVAQPQQVLEPMRPYKQEEHMRPYKQEEHMRPYKQEEHMRPYQPMDQENFASVENM